jgi:hypothetical protein
MVQTRSSATRKTRQPPGAKGRVQKKKTQKSQKPQKKKTPGKTPKGKLTHLDIVSGHLRIPIQIYDDGSIKDVTHYHPAIQALIKARVRSMYGFNGKGYVPFNGPSHRLTNKKENNNGSVISSRSKDLELVLDNGIIPLKMFGDGRIKDFAVYPDALRQVITTSLSRRGIDVPPPASSGKGGKSSGAAIGIQLLVNNIASIPIDVTPNGHVKKLSNKSPYLQQTILKSLRKLQGSPAYGNVGRKVGGSSSRVMTA